MKWNLRLNVESMERSLLCDFTLRATRYGGLNAGVTR